MDTVQTIAPGGPSKERFLELYRAELLRVYGEKWAADTAKLDTYIEKVRLTITGQSNQWNHDGECVRDAWKLMGCKGQPTLKALRGLS